MKFDQLTLVLISKLLLPLPFVTLLIIDISPPTTTHIGLFAGALLAGVICLLGIVPLAGIGYIYYLDQVVEDISSPDIENTHKSSYHHLNLIYHFVYNSYTHISSSQYFPT